MSSRRSRPLLLFGFMLGAVRAVAAQAPEPGSLADSIHNGGLAGARVSLTRLGISNEFVRFAITDSSGHFKFDQLVPGPYAVDFDSPLLESLEVGGTARRLIVNSRATAIVDLRHSAWQHAAFDGMSGNGVQCSHWRAGGVAH